MSILLCFSVTNSVKKVARFRGIPVLLLHGTSESQMLFAACTRPCEGCRVNSGLSTVVSGASSRHDPVVARGIVRVYATYSVIDVHIGSSWSYFRVCVHWRIERTGRIPVVIIERKPTIGRSTRPSV